MIRPPPITTRTDTLFPYTTTFPAWDDVAGHDGTVEPVPVVALPPVPPGGRADDQRGVCHASGDDDVGARTQRFGDTPAAEVGIGRDRSEEHTSELQH